MAEAGGGGRPAPPASRGRRIASSLPSASARKQQQPRGPGQPDDNLPCSSGVLFSLYNLTKHLDRASLRGNNIICVLSVLSLSLLASALSL